MLKNENHNIGIYCLVQKLSITWATYISSYGQEVCDKEGETAMKNHIW